MSERETIKDIDRAGLSVLAGVGLVPGLILAVIVVAFLGGRCSKGSDVALAAKVDTVRQTQIVRAAAAETVTVKLRAKARVDTLVETVTDTQLVVRESPTAPPETVTVKPQIVERIRVDSALIGALTFQVKTDSNVIRAQDNLIRALKPSRCQWKCGLTIGVIGGLLIHKAIK